MFLTPIRYRDYTGKLQFRKILREEQNLALKEHRQVDYVMAMYIYAMSLYKKDIVGCDEVIKKVTSDDCGMLLYSAISTDRMFNLSKYTEKEMQDYFNLAQNYKSNPQLIMLIYMFNELNEDLALEYAKGILKGKYKPW